MGGSLSTLTTEEPITTSLSESKSHTHTSSSHSQATLTTTETPTSTSLSHTTTHSLTTSSATTTYTLTSTSQTATKSVTTTSITRTTSTVKYCFAKPAYKSTYTLTDSYTGDVSTVPSMPKCSWLDNQPGVTSGQLKGIVQVSQPNPVVVLRTLTKEISTLMMDFNLNATVQNSATVRWNFARVCT